MYQNKLSKNKTNFYLVEIVITK